MPTYYTIISITHNTIQLNSSEPSVFLDGEFLVDDLHPWRNYTFEIGYSSPVGRGEVWTKCPTAHCHTQQGSERYNYNCM